MTVRQLIQYLMDLALEDPKILNYVVLTEAESRFILNEKRFTINHEDAKLEILA